MSIFEKSIQKSLEDIKKYAEDHPELMEQAIEEEKGMASCIVKCPTCGCPKIRRISSTEKVVNTMAFGFFGNKRKKQFECLNPKCKYKW